MLDDITMPMIAIGGGFTLLFVLVCILIVRARRITRRRRAVVDARRTRFHVAAIDPRIAEVGRAAFEDTPRSLRLPVTDEQVIQVVEIQPVVVEHTTMGFIPPPPRPDMRVRMHYLTRDAQPRQRLARGSTPGILPPVQTSHVTPHQPRPDEWDVPTAPSVTAQLRADRR